MVGGDRMRNVVILLAAAWVGLAFAPLVCAQSPGIKLVSSGEFTDKDGQVHAWKVTAAHTLIWDGQPYISVGGVFCSKYVSSGQTDENWQADVAALELIKSKGITDLLLKSVGPVTWTKPEAWQKLLDYLDSSGFTYGVDFADGPKAPLAGFIIQPTRYRTADIIRDSTFTFDMPDVTSALWMLCSASDGSVLSTGGAVVSDGKVKVEVKPPAGNSCVLLLYPEKELSNGDAGSVSDLWGGFGEFRDRLLKFLAGIKFGKGLRFFADPLTSKMDFSGERAGLVPDSADYRLEFEAYLAKKHLNIGSLNAAWGLTEDYLKTFQEAARLVPLWYGARGIPAAYDRARGKRYRIDTSRSRIWPDISDFRDSSAQNYMNTVADLLGRYGADVPVIYKASSLHRVFANSISRGGFEGLGVEAFGRGEGLVRDAAGPVYSLAEESARTMWYVVTGTADTPLRDKSTAGYASREAMAADLDSLAEVGAKGLFVLGLQLLPEDVWKNHSLISVPEQLDWLREIKAKFLSADRADYVPTVVYYPVQPAVGAETRRLAPGAWWLPSLRPGTVLSLGETVAGYRLAGQDGICVWSRTGPMTATLLPSEGRKPSLAYPANAPGTLAVDKKKITVKLGEAPIILTGVDPMQAFPLEVVEAEITKLAAICARAKAAGSGKDVADTAVSRVRGVLKSGLAARAYEMACLFQQQLNEDMGSYAWVEGEKATSHGFDGVASSSRVSAGAYLKLDSAVPPPMAPYSASYAVPITKEATHEIWIACSTPEAGASPFSYSIDNGLWQQAELSAPVSPYADGFAWFRIGSANLTKGAHTFQIRVDGPSKSGGYKLGVDVIVFSPTQFKPDGIREP